MVDTKMALGKGKLTSLSDESKLTCTADVFNYQKILEGLNLDPFLYPRNQPIHHLKYQNFI